MVCLEIVPMFLGTTISMGFNCKCNIRKEGYGSGNCTKEGWQEKGLREDGWIE